MSARPKPPRHGSLRPRSTAGIRSPLRSDLNELCERGVDDRGGACSDVEGDASGSSTGGHGDTVPDTVAKSSGAVETLSEGRREKTSPGELQPPASAQAPDPAGSRTPGCASVGTGDVGGAGDVSSAELKTKRPLAASTDDPDACDALRGGLELVTAKRRRGGSASIYGGPCPLTGGDPRASAAQIAQSILDGVADPDEASVLHMLSAFWENPTAVFGMWRKEAARVANGEEMDPEIVARAEAAHNDARGAKFAWGTPWEHQVRAHRAEYAAAGMGDGWTFGVLPEDVRPTPVQERATGPMET